jgi:hypothetical protein
MINNFKYSKDKKRAPLSSALLSLAAESPVVGARLTVVCWGTDERAEPSYGAVVTLRFTSSGPSAVEVTALRLGALELDYLSVCVTTDCEPLEWSWGVAYIVSASRHYRHYQGLRGGLRAPGNGRIDYN